MGKELERRLVQAALDDIRAEDYPSAIRVLLVVEDAICRREADRIISSKRARAAEEILKIERARANLAKRRRGAPALKSSTKTNRQEATLTLSRQTPMPHTTEKKK